MSINKTDSGLYVGIWEGIHKAFNIIDKDLKFDAKCYVFLFHEGEKKQSKEESNCNINNSINFEAAYLFNQPNNINTSNIEPTINEEMVWPVLYKDIVGNNGNSPNLNIKTKQEFSDTIANLRSRNLKKIYHLSLKTPLLKNKKLFYILIVLNNDSRLPSIENEMNYTDYYRLSVLPSWETAPLLNTLLLVSLVELGSKLLAFQAQATTNPLGFFNERELLNRAASLLLNTLLENNLKIEDSKLNYIYTHLEIISRTTYEKRATLGVLVITNPTNLNLDIKFAKHIKLSDHKAARKIIEMTNQTLAVSDGKNIFGLIAKAPENSLTVKFTGFNQWEVINENKCLFKSKNGIPTLPNDSLTLEKFTEKIKTIFNCSEFDPTQIYETIIQPAIKSASHGALILISCNAQEEAKRLGNQAIQLDLPTSLSKETLQGIFSIDGAILLDTTGRCHAIGVILDGLAQNSQQSNSSTVQENAARGSRFNSSVRYVNSQRNNNTKVAAIVISEDGQIDVI